MNRIYFRVTLILSILFYVNSQAQQQSSCDNADFEFNNFNNWTGRIGSCCPVGMSTTGIVPGRHTIVTGPGTDPQSGGLIPFVPPGGGQYAARLGNSGTGAQAEQLSYTFPVTSNTALFIYRYAVILQDPNHTPSAQPRFSIRVFDQNNNPVTCGTYDVVASGSIPGFVSIGNRRVKPWTTVGIELSSYVGQNMTIEFTTADCGHGAHFGFAYMDAYCSPFQINSDFCPGTNVTVLSAPPGFESYLWSNGDTTENVTVNNPIVGTVFSCTMTSVTGCQVTLNTILTPTYLRAAFYALTSCANRVQFIDSSYVITGTQINSWLWDFGDGTTSTVQHPVHAYSAPGNYQVMLVVQNDGCSDTLIKTINVIPPPQSEFTYMPACLGTPVNFTDQSTYSLATITSWTWNFGDGSPEVFTQHPMHIFANAGPYNVMLITEAANGCIDTVIKVVRPLIEPSPAFTYNSSCHSNIVDFTNQSNYLCGPIISHLWNFGDGSPASNLPAPSHTYPAKGIYQVVYRVEGLGGSTATVTQNVIVPEMPSADFNVTGACLNDANLFSDQSSVPAGSIVEWIWKFSDGNTASGNAFTSHVFLSPGTHETELVVTSNFNCSDSITKNVIVWELPLASFIADTLEGCEPFEVNFTPTASTSIGVIDGWNWFFGNGNSDSVTSPLAVYAAGTYNVTFVTTTNFGCKDTITINNMITAWPLPTPDFIHTPERVSIFLPLVRFIDRSWDAIKWSWDLGDNTITNEINPEHMYKAPGVYLVSLEVESPLGCRNIVTKIIEVVEEPTIYFPNAFTPNGDGTNDLFSGLGMGISEYRLYIFNRWGKLIFSSTHPENGWDGTYDRKPVQKGTYTYLANIIDINNKTHQVKGMVNVVK